MNEENNNVENQESQNYSYHFDPNASRDEDSYEDNNQENNLNQNTYVGGYQLNHGKTLVKSISSTKSSSRYPYGIRGNWNSGIISILGIAIILGIIALVITFLFV